MTLISWNVTSSDSPQFIPLRECQLQFAHFEQSNVSKWPETVGGFAQRLWSS
jgi:hypothetical protein